MGCRWFRGFEAAQKKAAALDPNNAGDWSRLGWLDAYVGRVESAKENFGRSMRLSPLDPMTFNSWAGLGAAHAAAGDYEVAIAHLHRALCERPKTDWIRCALSACLVGAGRMDEASVEAAELMCTQPDFNVARYLAATPRMIEVRKNWVS